MGIIKDRHGTYLRAQKSAQKPRSGGRQNHRCGQAPRLMAEGLSPHQGPASRRTRSAKPHLAALTGSCAEATAAIAERPTYGSRLRIDEIERMAAYHYALALQRR